MTQAQSFVTSLTTADRIAAQLAGAGARFLERFEENAFYALPDGSRVIVSEPAHGRRLVRAAPAIAA